MNLVLALVFVLQEGTAEETFHRIEEQLVKSKSLDIKFSYEMAAGGQKVTGSGSVQIKEGNRHRIYMSSGAQASKGEAWSVSDGRRVRSRPLPPDAPDADWAAPPSLKESLTVGLVRWGCFELYRLPFRMHNHGVNPKEKLVVSRLRYGEGKAGERPIAFRLEEGSGKAEVRLWFDPKTYALRKREVTLPGGESQFEGTLTETYEAFVVGGEIPDETFKFPDK